MFNPPTLPDPSAKHAREERYAAQDSKRRKMREDLEARERTVVRERTEEEKAKSRLKVRMRLAVFCVWGRARQGTRGHWDAGADTGGESQVHS